MIYIKNFGWRLGNQLFQIAAGHALAKRKGDKLIIPEWQYAKHFRGPFTMGEDKSAFTHTEPGFHYSPINYHGQLPVAIDGYFQSEKYFSDCQDDIRSMFSLNPNSEAAEEVNTNAGFLVQQKLTCSVHVRRGDYLNYPDHHPVLSADWYRRAMSLFCPSTVFWIFSDDIEWCKSNIDAPNVCYQHSSDVVDFFTMSLCNHHIIANSSFSWWAAWLNPSMKKRVIAPCQWFGSALRGHNTADLYCQGWDRQ